MKTAVITGGARNIGRGMVESLLEAGYRCIVLDKDEVALKSLKDQQNENVLPYTLDISEMDKVGNFKNWLDEQGLIIDLLINNVGYESDAKVADLSAEALDLSWRTNLSGPFMLTGFIAERTNKAIPMSVIFISSTHAEVPRLHPLYSSAKAAVEMFVKEAALELASQAIRVNAIAPGPVEAGLKDNKYVPLGKSIEPRDIAEAVLFLASDKARFITGATLTVDGGFSLASTHYWIDRGL